MPNHHRSRRLPTLRLAAALAVFLCLAAGGLTSAGAMEADPTPATGAAERQVGAARSAPDDRNQCPPVTDSIDRLYSAYFQRPPDDSGWIYWVHSYAKLDAGLPTMSQAFADSAEFISTYGSLDNRDFVTLVYNNVMGRAPDQAGFDHWVASLDAGYPRGSVMIAFSESEEYVTLTGTEAPLAGYLQWYNEPVRFVCGAGNDIATPYMPFEWADLLVANLGDQPVDLRWSLRNSHWGGDVVIDEPALPALSYLFYWNIPVDDMLPGTWGILLENGDRDDVRWIAVMHDTPHAADRLPYGPTTE